MIKVLIQGEHVNFHTEDSYIVDPLTSSVTLIRTGGKNILVDTGAFFMKQKLLEALRKENLQPDDIHFVVITHYHLDHTMNLHLFEKAIVHTPNAILRNNLQRVEIFKKSKKRISPPGIKIIDTKGHTHDHISVLFEENNKKYIVAGDAFREDIIRGMSPKTASDRDSFEESLKWIMETADVIIPGHGEMVEGERLEKIRRRMSRDELRMTNLGTRQLGSRL